MFLRCSAWARGEKGVFVVEKVGGSAGVEEGDFE